MMEQVPTPALSELPGYPRLVDALLAVRATEYSPIAAHVCATAAGWVYADHPGAVATEMVRRLGLEGVRCEEIVLHNDVMLVASTAILLQSACGRLGILCYRGTEPRNLMSWKVDFNVQPMFVPMRAGDAGEEAMVHLGSIATFMRRGTRSAVRSGGPSKANLSMVARTVACAPWRPST